MVFGKIFLPGFCVLALLGSTPAPANSAPATWQWPVPAPHHLVHPFDPPVHDWLPGHRGVDLSAPAHALVYATGGGVVTFAGELAGRGVIVIAHNSQNSNTSNRGILRTTYEPVDPVVGTGESVIAGQVIGALQTHDFHCLSPCLHLGLKRGATYLNPLLLFASSHVRLLPHLDQGSALASSSNVSAAQTPQPRKTRQTRTWLTAENYRVPIDQSCSASARRARIWMTALECI